MELEDFRNRLLVFNSALVKARIPIGSVDQVKYMEELAFPHVLWYNDRGEQSLKHFMLSLDAEIKVREDTHKRVYDGIYSIMNSAVTKIIEQKPQLTGRLIKIGSAHNHMKINEPDEFDFTFELDIHKLLNKNARIRTVKSYSSNRVLVLVDFEGESPDISEFDIVGYPEDPELDMFLSINGNKDAEKYKSMLSVYEDMYMLNTEAIAFALFNVLDSVVSNLDLPANWSHGGYNYPRYSGLRLNIPAYLMQFAYHGSDREAPLMISVDFAPVLKFPHNLRYVSEDLVDKFLGENGFIEYQWQRLEGGTSKGGYNSLAEEEWLSTYAPDSVPKIVIRVCKAFHNMVKLSTPKYLSKIAAVRIAEFRKLKSNEQTKACQQMNDFMMSMEHDSVQIGQLKSDTDFAAFRDIHEIVGEHDYVSSYIFKRLVMTLMAIDENQGRQWTTSDVPALVTSVFMTINDIIMFVNQAMPVIASVSQTDDQYFVFSMLPRSDVIQASSEAIQARQQTKTTELLEIKLDFLQTKCEEMDIYVRSHRDCKKSLQWYFRLHEAVRGGKCNGITNLFLRNQFTLKAKPKGLDEGIARVLEVLRSVAAGESKAVINIFRYSIQDDEELNVEDCLITRKDLDIMMKSSHTNNTRTLALGERTTVVCVEKPQNKL